MTSEFKSHDRNGRYKEDTPESELDTMQVTVGYELAVILKQPSLPLELPRMPGKGFSAESFARNTGCLAGFKCMLQR